jgi:hypothetical protein
MKKENQGGVELKTWKLGESSKSHCHGRLIMMFGRYGSRFFWMVEK